MLNLMQVSDQEIRNFGQRLNNELRADCQTFEGAAQKACERIYGQFVFADHKMFGLFRIFRLGKRDELPAEELVVADPAFEGWLALAGTMGLEPDWCSRFGSQGHRAIPIQAEMPPMLKAAFNQIDLDPLQSRSIDIKDTESLTRCFHVPIALDSPVIPAQDNFVKPYGIQSVIGLGSHFMDGSAYMALGFSRYKIDAVLADKVIHLAPYLSTLLAYFNGRGALWR